jgi:hypothetical protein
MLGAIRPIPQYAFMAWCLVKHRDNFTFNRVSYYAPRGRRKVGRLIKGGLAKEILK